MVAICSFGKMSSVTAIDERYYLHAGSIPLVRRISSFARKQVYKFFLKKIVNNPEETILDIGTSDETEMESNMLQQLYPHRDKITCASLSNGQRIRDAYPGVKHVQIRSGENLPFEDYEFDIVYSNAVLEHVGSRERQAEFLKEFCRVGKKRFLIIPNKLFPIEHHTGIPLINYLPQRQFRNILRNGKYDVWSHEENLNYIGPGDVLNAWPSRHLPSIKYSGIGFWVFQSNIIFYQT